MTGLVHYLGPISLGRAPTHFASLRHMKKDQGMGKAPTSRIDRLLSSMGYGTRREIALMAGLGRILLDGAPLSDVGTKISLTPDLPERMRVSGKPLDPLQGLVIILNKPIGMTCSHKEDGPLVYDLLPPRWRLRNPKISTIGRLDKQTSGLVLLTDDGELLHRVTSPRRFVPKTYRTRLARPLQGDEADIFAKGTLKLNGEDKPLAPARLKVLSKTEALLTITEGRYHQVRRMFAAVGNHVEALHRESFGGLHLPENLEASSWRLMTPEEVTKILDFTPGSSLM